ncbi:hypothetical protein DIPPA_01962 [Diplonema papillatum]|nr:hypothetical protein DIPPA_01962 [Diplonema papillatum]
MMMGRSMLSSMPTTPQEKVAFIFGRYDKDQDGIWTFSEAARFMEEVTGESIAQEDFPAFCKKLNATSVKGPNVEEFKFRYEGEAACNLETEFGMCLGLSACIA